MVATGRVLYLQKRIETMQEELDRIEALPNEPEGDDGVVIYWVARFPHGTVEYVYAAVKAGDGKWYTTGPATPKGYRWEDLITWIASNARPKDGVIWIASEWEPEILP